MAIGYLSGEYSFFAKIDKRNPTHGALGRASIRGKSNLPYVVMPAQDFEEFSLPAGLVHSGRLSESLDKQEGEQCGNRKLPNDSDSIPVCRPTTHFTPTLGP